MDICIWCACPEYIGYQFLAAYILGIYVRIILRICQNMSHETKLTGEMDKEVVEYISLSIIESPVVSPIE
jgi:hypothetical protein